MLVSGTLGLQRNLWSTGGWLLSSTRHRKGFCIKPHAHERPSLNVVLDGAYSESIRGTTRLHPPGAVVVKPAGESHANSFRDRGAYCLLLEVEAGQLDEIRRSTDVFDRCWTSDAAWITPIAVQLLRAVDHSDELADLTIEATILELIDRLTRRRSPSTTWSHPAWIGRAIEMLYESDGPVSLAMISREVCRDSTHVARAFRRAFGENIGTIARRLRIERAATALLRSDKTVGAVAQDAGFHDQSHLVREFRRHYSLTPSGFRRALRPR